MKTELEMLSALAKYCSQAERCIYDVQKKIRAENLSNDEGKRIINRLLQDKFINEKRFSRCFVHDKFQLNRWGRHKIAYELKSRGIPSDVYYEAIETIDEEEYLTALTDLLKNKKRSIKGRSQQDVFQKLCRFAGARGFETELVTRVLKKILKNCDND